MGGNGLIQAAKWNFKRWGKYYVYTCSIGFLRQYIICFTIHRASNINFGNYNFYSLQFHEKSFVYYSLIGKYLWAIIISLCDGIGYQMQENFMHINLQVLPLAYILFAFIYCDKTWRKVCTRIKKRTYILRNKSECGCIYFLSML